MQTSQSKFLELFLDLLSPLQLLMHQVWAGFYSQVGAISWLRMFPSIIPNERPEQFLNAQYLEVPINSQQLLSVYEPFLKPLLEKIQEHFQNELRGSNLANRYRECFAKTESQLSRVKNLLEGLDRTNQETLPRDFLYTLASELTAFAHDLYECGKTALAAMEQAKSIATMEMDHESDRNRTSS